MTLKDLQDLIRIYGGEAKVVDVLANLKLVAEMGTKLQSQ